MTVPSRATAPTGMLAAALLLATGSAGAGEQVTVALSQVPAALLQAARAAMPQAEFTSANTESEAGGPLVYELQGRTADGRKLEVDVFESGEIEEIEVEFTRDLVPGAVLLAVERAYPGFVPEFIEASHSAAKKVVQYEFVGRAGGRQLDLDVSADGRQVRLADD